MHLGHVNLYVRDAAASRDWYLKVICTRIISCPAAPRSCRRTRTNRTRSR